ncbi:MULTISPECIES: type I secretion system permease/ATPase [unclassified Ensifer]|uniref:type I secretion system permease/ATPase n=1 Tax=unclassified Ensifer TaxID=2633371 RepID=UPI0007157AB4|nr:MULTISPECIES: type I secretion system permease/ATPase [unclassified Ensifer]KQX44769.1 ABC transporter [Ensifer sp. Root1298]KQX76611.1 ABC transporter [Ensifer sp. Root1312]KRC17123.1 ABC transporter [Ensifer sp. Root74]KRD62153.1 ABC transporter [Ensifer sp. Root954]
MVDNRITSGSLRSAFRRSVIDLGLFSTVVNVLALTSPLFLIQVYDRVLPSSSIETLVYLTIIAFLAFAFLGLLDVIRAIYAVRMAAKLDSELGAAAFANVVAATGREPGDIQPLRDLATVRGFVASRGTPVLFDLPFSPVFAALLYLLHPLLFLMTTIGAIVILLLVFLNQYMNKKASQFAQERITSANLTAQMFSRNAETVRAMGMTNNVGEVWGRQFAAATAAADGSLVVNAIFGGISRSIRMILQMAILAVGATLVLKGQMTAGMIFASSILSGRALQPLDQLVGIWKQAMDARSAWSRFEKVIEAGSVDSRKLLLPNPAGDIAVRDLLYVSPDAGADPEPILKRLNFTIAAGESVAVVGPSRAGKSTLARLLTGAVAPTAGSITIDGADLRTWDTAQLGGLVGYLSQDVQLLPGTIAANISRFEPDAADEAVVAAARAAHANDLILSQAKGYQTPIGPGSNNLSGGERQRIGLARAFYGSPRLLVLDEPNANLDSEGEAALGRALRDAKARGVTVVIVTHRISIATTCDRILVMKNGRIDDFGPTDEVARRAQSERADRAAKAAAVKRQTNPPPTNISAFLPGRTGDRP